MRGGPAVLLLAAGVLSACGETYPETRGCSHNGDRTNCTVKLWACGIKHVRFEGSMWQADDYETTIDAQTAPPGWDDKGLMTLVQDDEALYVDESGLDVLFRPADEVPDAQCG